MKSLVFITFFLSQSGSFTQDYSIERNEGVYFTISESTKPFYWKRWYKTPNSGIIITCQDKDGMTVQLENGDKHSYANGYNISTVLAKYGITDVSSYFKQSDRIPGYCPSDLN